MAVRSVPMTAEAGLGLMVAAMLIAPAMDVLAKLLTATMSPGQVALARFAMQSAILAPLLIAAREWGPPHRLHAAAGALLACSILTINAALAVMPVANVIAIFFVEPLILTLLAALVLGERLGWRRLTAVAVGLAGAIVVIRPNWAAYGPSAVLPLATAVLFAGYMLVTRRMSQAGRRLHLQFWSGAVATAILAGVCLAATAAGLPVASLSLPEGEAWVLIAAMGLVGTLAHLLLTQALGRVEAGAAAPLQYLEILSAVLLGWAVFGDLPDGWTWAGTAVIVGAGIYVFAREHQLSRARLPEVAP